MRISKKILAIALSILMAVSMMPFTVFADDDYEVSVKVGTVTTNYATFEEGVAALDGVTSLATITLLKDVDLESTIDFTGILGGSVGLTINTGGSASTPGYKITSTGADPAFNIKNAKVYFSGFGTIESASANCSTFRLQGMKDATSKNYSQIQIRSDVTVISHEFAVFVDNNNGYADGVNVQIMGDITATYGVYINGNVQTYGKYPANFELQNGSSLTSTGDIAIYAAGYAKWTIGKSVVTGATAMYAKCGDIRIYAGATLIGNGPKADFVHNGSGAEATGAALVIENAAGYSPDMKLDITNCHMTSVNTDDAVQSFSYSKGDVTREAITGFIKGGEYSPALADELIADGYETTNIEGSKYVVSSTAAAYYYASDIWNSTDNLSTAINSAANGTTIYVVKDGAVGTKQATVSGGASKTLDLQGHDVTLTFGSETDTKTTPSISLGVTTSTGTSTSGTLNIVSSTPATITTAYGVVVKNTNSALTVGDNVTLKSTDSTYTAFIDSGAKDCSITVDGSVVNENEDGAALYVHGNAGTGNTVTVNGDVTGTEAGIYAAGKATYNINGNVTGDTGIYAAQGTVNVASTAHVTGTGAKADYVYDGSGFNSTGDGIAVDNKYATAPVVNVASDATLESYTAKAYNEYKNEATAQGEASVTVADDAILIEHNYVAEINGVGYSTLAEAVAAAQGGDTITLLEDCSGNGIKVAAGRFADSEAPLVIDFNGHTYTVDGATVGSPNTQTNGFQLLKNNYITFKNGAITSEKAKILIQNYSNLTLDGMTLTSTYPGTDDTYYTLSNNYGNVVINDTTINAPANGYAFDISTGWSSAYTAGVTVTMKGDSVINGDIEVGSYANYDGVAAIQLESGQLNGELVTSEYDTSWHKVSDEIGGNITVTKNDTCTYAAPEGYEWVSNGDGTSTLAPVEEEYEVAANFTLDGSVNFNAYLDKDYPVDYTVEVTYNHSSNVSKTAAVATDTMTIADLDVYSGADAAYAGYYMFSVKQAPSQIGDDIRIVIKDTDGNVVYDNTVKTSEICKTRAKASDGALQTLYQSIVDYGKAAQAYFGGSAVADTYYNAAVTDTATAIPSTGGSTTIAVNGVALVVTSELGINIYTADEVSNATITMDGGSSAVVAEAGIGDITGTNVITVRGIDARDLGKNFTVTTDQGTITMSAYTVARSILAGSSDTNYQNLARAMYLYGEAAAAYLA